MNSAVKLTCRVANTIVSVKLAGNARLNPTNVISLAEESLFRDDEIFEDLNISSGAELHFLHPSSLTKTKVHGAAVNDACYSNDENVLPEVDLISLLEERLPRYTLRADALTNFSGYGNADWSIQTPCLSPDIDFEFSPQFIEETLKYFVMSGDRLTKMTQAYSDIGAVTMLLEEKERDLELAAKIGQKLLADNCSLHKKNDSLEEQLHQATEKVSQLQHVIAVKDALLQIYVSDRDDLDSPGPAAKSSMICSTSSATVDVLQRKIGYLESENASLRLKVENMSNTAGDLEEREDGLIRDCVHQLSETTERLQAAHEEVAAKSQLAIDQHEKIKELLCKIDDLERQKLQLLVENEELQKQLAAMNETQQELVSEIMDWEEKYSECLALLRAAQEEVRELQKTKKPGVIRYHFSNQSPYLSGDSLAVQLENSLRKNLASGEIASGHHAVRAMKMTRLANAAKQSTDSCSLPTPSTHSPASSTRGTGEGVVLVNSSSVANGCLSVDTDASLYDANQSECDSPESFMSTGSRALDISDARQFQHPKLQIVKPMEGSETLHKWRLLSMPHLGGVLEQRPGVQIKGQRLENCGEEEMYSISDIEEDDEFGGGHGWATTTYASSTAVTYTYTTSKMSLPSTNKYVSTNVGRDFFMDRALRDLPAIYTSDSGTDGTRQSSITSGLMTGDDSSAQRSSSDCSQRQEGGSCSRLVALLQRLGFAAATSTVDNDSTSSDTTAPDSAAQRSVVDDEPSTLDVRRPMSARAPHSFKSSIDQQNLSAVGLNNVMSIKRRLPSAAADAVGVATAGVSTSLTTRIMRQQRVPSGDLSKICMRAQVVHKTSLPVSSADCNNAGDVTVTSTFVTQSPCVTAETHASHSSTVTSSVVQSCVPSVISNRCSIGSLHQQIPSIMVSPETDEDGSAIDNSTACDPLLNGDSWADMNHLSPLRYCESYFPVATSCSPSLPASGSWNFPSSPCRDACVLTSSLTTVVHSRVSDVLNVANAGK